MLRWSLRILPKGYTKTRRFGGYSNHHRQLYITECRELMAIEETSSTAETDTESTETAREHLCPNCNIPLRLVSYLDRPGWYITMNGPHRPDWYDDS